MWYNWLLSGLGLLWTGVCLWLLLAGRARLAHPSASWLAGGLLAISLSLVLGEIAQVEALAGGLRVLDARLRYSPADAAAFAEALGPAGRIRYASFQLSFDTLAPPAFACFAASAAARLLSARQLRSVCWLMLAYLACVLPANALMPLYMLHYPQPGWQEGLSRLVPLLDAGKYSLHLLAWALIVTAAGYNLLQRLRAERRAGLKLFRPPQKPDATLKAGMRSGPDAP